MSKLHSHQNDHSEAHEGPIKTPKQLITAVVFGFLVPIVVIILLVHFVVSDKRTAEGQSLNPEAVARRIEPVGQVLVNQNASPPIQAAPVTPAAPAQAPAIMIPPAQTKPTSTVSGPPALYVSACAACHDTGAAGSPKLGDKTAWASRLTLGMEGLTASVIKGKGIMPARGGSQGSDDEIKAAVTYIVNQSQ